ncbi:MAG: cellulase family glycosylhydrolase [Verrucomicrobiales bacterium]|nr:cellulase family glycosylhydrolase [Verrucomicrobiales bacterium]
MNQYPAFLTLAFSVFTLSIDASEPAPEKQAGLIVSDGHLIREGRAYRGVGANYFSLFHRILKDPTDKSYDEGLRRLSEAQIPFVRFMAGGFWPVDWDLYMRDKEDYFKRMDAVVRSAEKHQIGLIPSLFWNMATFPDIVGEPMDQLGNEKSKTIAFIEQYTTEMVLRYRNSPAIWGWEFGNEYNMLVDLPNASSHRPKIAPHLKTGFERTSRDELSSEAMLTAFGHFARTVRKHDAHRILITGNSIPRRHAFHNSKERSWKPDNRPQFESVLRRDNPSPYDVTCVHIYGNNGQGSTKSISELVETLQEISGRTRQPLFIGEFGAPSNLGSEKEKSLFAEMLGAIEANNVPLSAFWVFDYPGQNTDWNVTFENERSYMLKIVAEANHRMRADLRDNEKAESGSRETLTPSPDTTGHTAP